MKDDAKTPAHLVRSFRESHELTTEAMDRLCGFSSKGRTTRRWESVGAPYYVTILMAYANKFGIGLMEKLATDREAAGP